ncbi:hypothetical protein [Caproicibacter sp.]|uniref:hypothetical protein n=1 Tax=Caproicibacter sp. TaxID=2814884 RepID=UPI0039891E5E
MIISHDISSLFTPYLQPGQSWSTMTAQQKQEVMDRIPTAKNTVKPTVAKVEVQHSDGLYGAGGNGYISYNDYIALDLSDAYLWLGYKENDAETLKSAVLALQQREQLAQDSSHSAEFQRKNKECIRVIRAYITDQANSLSTALTNPTLLLTKGSGYTQQKANRWTYQALTKIYSAVTPEELGLQGISDMTGSQMIDALNQFESTISGVMDQISSMFTGKSGGEKMDPWSIQSYDDPEQMFDHIINIFGSRYGLDPNDNPYFAGEFTTDLVDPPEWMLHMFDCLDETV